MRQPRDVSLRDRGVETERFAEPGDAFRSGLLPQHLGRVIARQQADSEKDDRGNGQQHAKTEHGPDQDHPERARHLGEACRSVRGLLCGHAIHQRSASLKLSIG